MSHKSSPERDALIAALLEQMRQQLEHSLPDDAATFDQIEDAAGKIGRALSQEVQRSIAYLHTTGIHVNPRQRSVTDYGNL